ncbi:hypothetical protein COE15_27230 [Bacillus cereus]|uniref:hypothetical protein n=1 Tax=Bacillus TaxID=1386 RepID=UPI00047BCE0E|nr:MULTISPECIES: hypothetical protein [Bacillus]PGX89878.1 hypothetical protein COE15_27230 [Bacillus cereus]WIY63133.1 hypothetical protein QRY57_12025 [Bacillus arachidis]
MGLCVDLFKEYENEEEVVYRFFPCEEEEKSGKIQFNKLEKRSVELEPAKVESADYYFLKAVGSIQKHARNSDEFPEFLFSQS